MNIKRTPSRNRTTGIGSRVRDSIRKIGSLISGNHEDKEEFYLSQNRTRFVRGGVRTRSNRGRSNKRALSNKRSTFGRSSFSSTFASSTFGEPSTLGSRTSEAGVVLDGFEFSALALDESVVRDCVVEMLMQTITPVLDPGLDYHDHLLRISVHDLVMKIQESYTNTSYHNFFHVVDVTQLMYTFVTNYFHGRLEAHQPFFLLFICLCHDMYHPGASIQTLHENGFLLEYKSLEDYHIAETEKLIYDHPIFVNYMDPELRLELLDLARVLITATNLAEHDHVTKIVSNIQDNSGKLVTEHLMLLMKVADLANVVRDFEDAQAWSAGLTIEMKASESLTKEGDARFCENLDKVSILLYMHQEKVRKKNQFSLPENMGDFTIAFIKNFVEPLSKLIKNIDEDLFRKYDSRLGNNKELWMNVTL